MIQTELSSQLTTGTERARAGRAARSRRTRREAPGRPGAQDSRTISYTRSRASRREPRASTSADDSIAGAGVRTGATLMPFQYIAIEGPIGVGKSSLTRQIAARLDATAVLEDTEQPSSPIYYSGRTARLAGAAVLSASTASPVVGLQHGRSVFARDGMRLPVRQGQDFRLPQSRRQTSCSSTSASRPAREGRTSSRSRHLLQAPTDVLVRGSGTGREIPPRDVRPEQGYIRELNEPISTSSSLFRDAAAGHRNSH